MVAQTPLLADPFAAANLREHRRRTGTDKWDEVWDGRYVFMPPRWNWEASAVGDVCYQLTRHTEGNDCEVFPGVNVSDRRTDWERNYRCPDVALFLPANPAEAHEMHYFGGPDLAVETVTDGDLTMEKLPFYAAVGVRELWVLDRDPWRLSRYTLAGSELKPDGAAEPGGPGVRSAVLPLDWALEPGDPPAVRLTAA